MIHFFAIPQGAGIPGTSITVLPEAGFRGTTQKNSTGYASDFLPAIVGLLIFILVLAVRGVVP